MIKFDKQNSPQLSDRSSLRAGFTLIEVLVVMAITVYLTLNLLSNFLRSDINLDEMASIVVSDIRKAQADALASKQYNNTFRCGYGFHMLTASQATTEQPFSQTYYVYTSRQAPPNCGNYDYQPNDSDVVTLRVLDSRLRICGPTSGQDSVCNLVANGNNVAKSRDIFFSSPFAKTYIGGQACPIPGQAVTSYSQILLIKEGATAADCAAGKCRYICIYGSGKIEARSSACEIIDC